MSAITLLLSLLLHYCNTNTNNGINIKVDNWLYCLVFLHHNTDCTATVQPCVNGDWLCQWEMAIFDPCRIDPLQPPPKNLSEMIMLATPTALQNLVHICP